MILYSIKTSEADEEACGNCIVNIKKRPWAFWSLEMFFSE